MPREKHIDPEKGQSRHEFEKDGSSKSTKTELDAANTSVTPSDRHSSDQDGEAIDQHDLRQLQSVDPYEEDVAERVASHTTARSRRSMASSRRTRRGDSQSVPEPIPVTDLDKGLVGWDGQDDPAMPLNFNSKRKWTIVVCVATITFLTPFASSILAPAIRYLADDFGYDPHGDLTMPSFPVSVYLLGYAVGPLFLSPLSEIYGRHLVLSSANTFFCLFLVGCALAPSLDALIVFRFFTGVGGSGCLTIGGGIIADMIPVHQRGKAITVWMVGPLIGPTIGPLIGAFVAQDIGWRWTAWIVLIAAAPTVLAIAVLSRETNARVLIHRKTLRLRRELNRPDLRSVYDPSDPTTNTTTSPPTSSQILLRGLLRPLKLLFLSPLLFSLSVYIAFCYGVLYLLFNTIPLVFQQQYAFSLGHTGLIYLFMGAGYALSLALFLHFSDRTVVRMTAANGGHFLPEMRLPASVWYAFLLPVTFFWYGWTAASAPHTHWAAAASALLPLGFGLVGVWQPIQAYVIDAFPEYAASALAAFTVFRSVVAAFLPLAGPEMYQSLGLGWGNSLLGFIAVALIPVPLLIYKFGARLRKHKPKL